MGNRQPWRVSATTAASLANQAGTDSYDASHCYGHCSYVHTVALVGITVAECDVECCGLGREWQIEDLQLWQFEPRRPL